MKMNLEPYYNEAKVIINKYGIDSYYTILPVLPIPYITRTKADKWKKRDVITRYYSFKDDVRLWNSIQKYELKEPLSLIFCLPIPDSYLKKRDKLLHEKKRTRPDIDNYIKSFQDSCHKEDGWIAEYGRMLKVYSDNPMIIIL